MRPDAVEVDSVRIECLGCGEARAVVAPASPKLDSPARTRFVRAATLAVERQISQKLDPGECPRCGYLGWAPSTALTEPMRRRIRERPVDRRAAIYAV
jgi:hypothetical protein